MPSIRLEAAMPNAPSARLRSALLASALALVTPTLALAQTPPPATGYVDPNAPQSPWGPGWAPAPPAPAPLPEDAAEPPPSAEDGPAFDLALATELPILLGAQATVELPLRLLLQGEIGVLPGAYVDAVDGALTGAGAYDASTSELVRNGLRDSLVVRLSGGIRPFADHGLELLGGYTLSSLGAGVSARAAVEAATGMAVPAELGDTDVVVRSTVHSVQLSVGWRWVVADHLVLRASLGYLQAVSSSSHLEVPAAYASNAAVTSVASRIDGVLDAKLDDVLTTYVKLPLVGLSLGYRF